jgi:hypothetical protein
MVGSSSDDGVEYPARRAEQLTTRAAWRIATELKASTPCADCGGRYPYWVMQLDHVAERGPKAFTISLTYTSGRERRVMVTEKELRAEIAKCDIVCANCHAERTHARGGQRWGRAAEDSPALR